MRENLQQCQKLLTLKRNVLADNIIEATECLKAWWAPTAGRLVWSDAEGFNSLAAVMYSNAEPSIVEEP
jgi:hypothetical protein